MKIFNDNFNHNFSKRTKLIRLFCKYFYSKLLNTVLTKLVLKLKHYFGNTITQIKVKHSINYALETLITQHSTSYHKHMLYNFFIYFYFLNIVLK